MSGGGHPLPASGEARHEEIPEHLEREKGRGDDSKAIVQPQDEAVTPDGEPYRNDDLGRGPETIDGGSKEGDTAEHRNKGVGEAGRDGVRSRAGGNQADGEPGTGDGDDFASDQAKHQDRGQSVVESESGGR